MRFIRAIALSAAAAILCFSLTACNLKEIMPGGKASVDEQAKGVEASAVGTELPSGLKEDRSIYSKDKPDELVNLYVTVLKSYDRDGKLLTLTDLNTFNYFAGGTSPRLDVIVQEGDENGPKPGYFGFGTTSENGAIETRGHSAQSGALKSYRIKLYNKAGLWRDQQTINLNKHPSDVTKARNKLSFDYFKMIPDMASLRTTYVHLRIRDLSQEGDGEYKDMGLYVQIEQPNKRFLRMHGLDPGANLYKAESFEFQRYPESIKMADDPSYKKEDFEKRLEIKGNEDHRKVISMLEEVNDLSLNIDNVVDRHFDRDNYLTWLATNIIFGNVDVTTQNFFLYSPANEEKFYFLPWDYDGAWGYHLQERNEGRYDPWLYGISRFWNGTIHKRFFKNPDNISALNKKIEELMKIVTKERTESMLDSYYKLVEKFVGRSPDLDHLGVTLGEFEREYAELSSYPERNLEIYYKSLEAPMPIFLSQPVTVDGKTEFSWDHSYDLQGDDITYDFKLSTAPNFEKLVAEKKGLSQNKYSIDKLPGGVYYYSVIIKDSKGNSQVAFDMYQDVDDVKYFGVMKFRVE